MKNLVGKHIGKYQLVEEVGKGGMAVVYKAYQTRLERWVAVKVLDPIYTADNLETLTRFRQEARAIAALRHPNILTVYDYGDDEGLEYIVMEYVEGGTLKQRLTGTPFDWPRAATLTIAIGKALAFAHGQGIIHRDVKPANVLLPAEDWPLLADFGLAKIKQERQALTGPGIALGTPAYTPPEQALGETIDHRADIYALGVVLFEMLTGRTPFFSDKPFDILLMHMGDPPPSPCDLVSGIPKSLNDVILKTLEKNPEDRFGRMTDVVTQLQAICDDMGHKTEHPSQSVGSPATVEINSARKPLEGPHFTVFGTETLVPIPGRGPVLLGRSDPTSSKPVDIDLSNYGGGSAGVSRLHARLVLEDDHWFVEDLCSTNGTYVNREYVPADRRVALKNGDRVRFGQLLLVFHEGITETLHEH